MSNKKTTRRERLRAKPVFPAGMFVGLLTGSCVTLVGIFSGLDSTVILTRSFTSGILLGCIVSLGVSIVRMADSESKKQQAGRQ